MASAAKCPLGLLRSAGLREGCGGWPWPGFERGRGRWPGGDCRCGGHRHAHAEIPQCHEQQGGDGDVDRAHFGMRPRWMGRPGSLKSADIVTGGLSVTERAAASRRRVGPQPWRRKGDVRWSTREVGWNPAGESVMPDAGNRPRRAAQRVVHNQGRFCRERSRRTVRRSAAEIPCLVIPCGARRIEIAES